MDYIKILNLTSEPFSNSPDPKFLFHSNRTLMCLQRLELSIRLRRGLSIVIGDVGTGKTTLSRSLIQRFQSETDKFKFYLIIDPCYVSEEDFLINLLKIFNISPPPTNSALAYKEAIRHFLLQGGIKKGKVIILIVDEAQKISDESLEVLRSLLNFETNEFKLLQLVIFAQTEFYDDINKKTNFTDRIDTLYTLKPLDEDDTRRMIEFRLHQAGWTNYQPLFTPNAIRLIYLYTQGFPRKIITTCHHCLLAMLISKKNQVDTSLVNQVLKDSPERYNENIQQEIIKEKKINALSIGVVACLIIFLFISIYLGVEYLSPLISSFDLQNKPSSTMSTLSSNCSFSPGLPPKPNFNLFEKPIKLPNTHGEKQKKTSLSPYILKIPEKQSEKTLPVIASLTMLDNNLPNQDKPQRNSVENQAGNSTDTKNKTLSATMNDVAIKDTSKPQQIYKDPQKENYIEKKKDKTIENKVVQSASPQKNDTHKSSYREVTVRKGDFIHKMAMRVYQTSDITDAIINKIAAANPKIPDINRVYAGQKIRFPIFMEIQEADKKKELGGYNIRVGYFFNIYEAEKCVENLKAHGYKAYMEKEKFSNLGDRYKIMLERLKDEERAKQIAQKVRALDFPYARVLENN
ncbi:MAG: AAA family ATPase [bacterium]